MSREIPLYKNYIDKSEANLVSSVVNRKMNWAIGPEITEFEDKVANMAGCKNGLAFNSGTSAGHALMNYYNVKNCEVIVPSFTFIATSNVVLMEGGKPVFADIEEDSLGLDPNDVNEKITDKTKVIMPIHYGGNVCKIREIKEIAEDHKITLVEDASESLSATVNHQKVGSFGDSSWFSFAPTKVVSTGEGGMITSDNLDLIEKSKLFRSHGRVENSNYFSSKEDMDYVSLGYNFRMPSMNAALGIAQIEKIDKIVELRNKVANFYIDNLQFLKEINFLKQNKNIRNVYQMFPIILKSLEFRDGLKKYLDSKNIGNKIFFKPVHESSFYSNKFPKFKREELPITQKISERILCLPIFPQLKEEEQRYIVDEVIKFCKEQ